MIVRVNAVVEGQTEEAFVRTVLAEHLGHLRVSIVARRVTTSRAKRVRGGMTSFERAKRDIVGWLKEDKSAYVTTMFDLYRLPTDFPGWHEAEQLADRGQRIKALEQALADQVESPRFVPYLQLHEFEALLFSDVDAIDRVLSAQRGGSKLARLNAIRGAVASPEEINDGRETSPSHRLEQLYSHYDKPLHGQLVSQHVGLARIREACQHFDAWVSRLERLAGESLE